MKINKPVAIIIILAVNVILIFLFVMPKYQESGELQMNLTKTQIEYDSQSDHYIKLLSIIKNIEERDDLLEKVDSALPSNFSLSSVMYFLQTKAIESQLTVKSVTFSGVYGQILQTNFNEQTTNLPAANGVAVQGSGIKSVVLSVNLSGSYQGLKNFLYSLDRSARLFQVETISFAPLKSSLDQGQPQTYDFKLEVKTYTY